MESNSSIRLKIGIIGRGNVATHLERAFRSASLEIVQINSRSLLGLGPDFNVLLIAVSDKAIEEVADRVGIALPKFKGIVAHTAGSVDASILSPFFENYGVFYPLQTFSRNIEITDYSEIPVFVEGSPHVLPTLEWLGFRISKYVYVLDSERRKTLHLASVFACNFVNAMYSAAEDILKDCGLPFDVVTPLIRQTMLKALQRSPKECQTGPASRKDTEVLRQHLDMLASRPELAAIYEAVSKFIMSKKD